MEDKHTRRTGDDEQHSDMCTEHREESKSQYGPCHNVHKQLPLLAEMFFARREVQDAADEATVTINEGVNRGVFAHLCTNENGGFHQLFGKMRKIMASKVKNHPIAKPKLLDMSMKLNVQITRDVYGS